MKQGQIKEGDKNESKWRYDKNKKRELWHDKKKIYRGSIESENAEIN